jgi:hypothetical protein
MPLQKIETIDEPASRAMVQDNLFDPDKAHRDDFRNRLIWGDNKLVMASLLNKFAEMLTIHASYDFCRDRPYKKTRFCLDFYSFYAIIGAKLTLRSPSCLLNLASPIIDLS